MSSLQQKCFKQNKIYPKIEPIWKVFWKIYLDEYI